MRTYQDDLPPVARSRPRGPILDLIGVDLTGAGLVGGAKPGAWQLCEFTTGTGGRRRSKASTSGFAMLLTPEEALTGELGGTKTWCEKVAGAPDILVR